MFTFRLNTIGGQTEVRLELYTEFTGTKLGSGTVHSSGTSIVVYRVRRKTGEVPVPLKHSSFSLYKKVSNLIYPRVLWFKVFLSSAERYRYLLAVGVY